MSSMHLSQFRRWFLSSPPAEWIIQQLRELLIGALRQGPIPQHVAFVMDGNRRFARTRQIETVEGHNLGFEALARVLEVCYKSGVKVITIYAFSIENFKRSKYEVDALMEMAKVKLSQLAQHGELLDRYGARIRILGQRDLLKPDVLEAMDNAAKMTSGNRHAILNVCFPYTSRDEITTAIRETVIDYSKPLQAYQRPFSETHIRQNIRARHLHDQSSSSKDHHHHHTSEVAAGAAEAQTSDAEGSTSSSNTLNPDSAHEQGLRDETAYADPETITSETLDDHMFTAGNPPLDLLVRTSGVERLSDFMLWQCHENTHLAFLDCLWPEFDLWTFLPVLIEWQWKQKRLEQRKQIKVSHTPPAHQAVSSPPLKAR
ncbi:Undecaprenyl diphosphate synthase [Xylona heveae TC161]|uniref:Alkyl transferase n=1 Tax=Xylona heveae (strain CBS 132557 / TC161) TaxID=1328760 RepID=A0A164ZU69_XYLHT|nr:Undecaprenyl diphosphate synthase [Xylona heveae TC161]KZF19522.1 Undecaprenyl diphosphate synthase [Xylona heveae TC161]